jgi:inosine-uridine nucleoside N-ribohydrolase
VAAAGWVLTCDPGVDDAVALAVAAGRPDARLVAVVAGAGNVDALTAWRNAAGMVELAGVDVPVGLGSAAAVDGSAIHRHGSAHGPDGLAGLAGRLPAADARVRVPGRPLVQGDIVATGPLTDVAIAVRSGQPVDRVVWLGGTAADLAGTAEVAEAPAGHSTRGPEFNAAADPDAVNTVAAAPAPLSIVPLDVSRRVVLGPDAIDRWAMGPRPARFCADLVTARHGPAGGSLPDTVAVVAALEPRLFRWAPRLLRCATEGPHPRGTLVADDGADGVVRVAVDLDAAAVRDRIVDAVMSLT